MRPTSPLNQEKESVLLKRETVQTNRAKMSHQQGERDGGGKLQTRHVVCRSLGGVHTHVQIPSRCAPLEVICKLQTRRVPLHLCVCTHTDVTQECTPRSNLQITSRCALLGHLSRELAARIASRPLRKLLRTSMGGIVVLRISSQKTTNAWVRSGSRGTECHAVFRLGALL